MRRKRRAHGLAADGRAELRELADGLQRGRDELAGPRALVARTPEPTPTRGVAAAAPRGPGRRSPGLARWGWRRRACALRLGACPRLGGRPCARPRARAPPARARSRRRAGAASPRALRRSAPPPRFAAPRRPRARVLAGPLSLAAVGPAFAAGRGSAARRAGAASAATAGRTTASPAACTAAVAGLLGRRRSAGAAALGTGPRERAQDVAVGRVVAGIGRSHGQNLAESLQAGAPAADENEKHEPAFCVLAGGQAVLCPPRPVPGAAILCTWKGSRTIDRAPERYRRVTNERAHASSQRKNPAGPERSGGPNGL
jgi:hypothetical protein